MIIKELLPIGTIVLLKNGEKKLMIFGVKQEAESGQKFDYIGVFYPEGNMGIDYQFLFNHDDIGEIIVKGFEDQEREEFIDRLSKFYNE